MGEPDTNTSSEVVILLSAYNGEKYVEQQLESIFSQTYPNIRVIVRDDGSTDCTVDILQMYADRGLIELVTGENIGFIKSFTWLLENAGEADYYSFADQDDVWLPDKIERAVTALQRLDDSQPVFYFSNFDYYDQDMQFIAHSKPLKAQFTLSSTLLDFKSRGFTCVFNNKLRQLFLLMDPENLFPHDYLSLLIGASMGDVVYDPQACAKYRRHGTNVSITNESFLKLQIWRIKNFLLKDDFNYKQKFADFYSTYESYLSDENKRFMRLFLNKRYRPDHVFIKMFYPARFRDKLFDELALRFMFFIGHL